MPPLLHHTVLTAAERDPDLAAFRCGENELTRHQLATRAVTLAATLHQSGIRRGDRVGIFMPRSTHQAVALYGTLMAGAAFVPIDPTAPAERVAFILRNCGIRHLLTHPDMKRRLARLESHNPTLDLIVGADANPFGSEALPWDQLQAESTTPPDRPDSPGSEDDLAYILFTSGSTGTPKGIAHTHRSGLAFARLSAATYDVRPGDRLGTHSPLHFDISTFGFLTGPFAGATTVLFPDEAILFPAALAKLAQAERLTHWYSVPLALVQLLQRGDLPTCDLASLRWVMFAGEPMPPKHLRALAPHVPNARFSNLYGPTETNVCTVHHLDTPPQTDAPLPIGTPWPETDIRIIDDELLVRSTTLMQGYWNRADLNQAAFTPDGFYRTGDLVRRRPDGRLDFLGRRDRQIKLRGHRIELDEIEAGLNAHPSVIAAAVFLTGTSETGLTLHAAAEVLDDTPPAILRATLSDRLPTYALPKTIHILDALPKTPTGKIDHRALSKPKPPTDPRTI